MKWISGLKPEKKNRVQAWKWKTRTWDAEFWVYFNRPIYRWSEYSSHRLAGRMAYSCKKKKSSAWLTSTEPNRSVSTFIIILIFFCRYINKTCLMFLEGTRAYETTNSPYFFNAIMHNLFSLTVLFSLLGAVHKICCIGRGEGVSPKDNLLHRSYLIKKTTRGSKIDIVYGRPPRVQKWHLIWTTHSKVH